MTNTAFEVSSPAAIPTAPGRLPLLGHANAIWKNPVDFLTTLPPIGELVQVYVGPVRAYAATSPALVYRILATESSKFERGMMFDKMRGIFGNGLVTSSGAFHRRQRRLVQPAFGKQQIADYAAVMRRKCQEMVAPWRAGDAVDVQAATDRLSLSVAVAALCESELDDSHAETIKEFLPVLLRGLIVRTLLPDVVFKLPVPGIRRFPDAERRLRVAFQEIIKTYRAEETHHRDLLSAFLAARDDEANEGMNDTQVLDEVVSIILAATETTSSVLASLFFRLSEHPEIAERMRAEIDQVLGGRPVEYADVTRLPYTLNVLSEVLRMDQPVPMLMRRSVEEVVLGTTRFPAGSEFIISIPALHRNPDVYQDPNRFNPDRWTHKPAKDLPRGAYIPFGAGGHICVGNGFAWTELTVAAATVLSKWRLTVAPGARPRRVHRATSHFTSLPMVVESR